MAEDFAELFAAARASRGRGGNDFFVVRWDDEMSRIVAIPVRPPDLKYDLTDEFQRPGNTKRLWALQSFALHEARLEGGLLAPMGVGHGKFLTSMLLPRAMGSRTAVYLCPSQLRQQVLHVDYPFWNRHFFLPELGKELHVVTYEELSRANTADVLDRLKPTLVIADEAHKLRHREAARTKRWIRYMRQSGADFCALSGTMTTRNLEDYAHLAEFALRRHSPVPSPTRSRDTLREWSEALDAPKKGETPRSPGALLTAFCSAEEKKAVVGGHLDPQTVARTGFRRRLVSTPGVVASEEGSLGTSLIIQARRMTPPPVVDEAIIALFKTWRIGDEELEEATRIWAVARQLSLGFYYVWKWPLGIKDFAWLMARAAWHRRVREYLTQHAHPGMDSPLLLANAADRGEWNCPEWFAWKEQRKKPPPPVGTEWLSDFAVRDVQKYLLEDDGAPAILWYEQQSFGAALAQLPGVRFFPPGDESLVKYADACLNGSEKPVHIVLSLKSHGTGKNLPAWSRQLFTCPPANGTDWEQGLGRTHRPGQQADAVWATVYQHTGSFVEAFTQAMRDAEYQERTTGQRQRLLFATRLGFIHELAIDNDDNDRRETL